VQLEEQFENRLCRVVLTHTASLGYCSPFEACAQGQPTARSTHLPVTSTVFYFLLVRNTRIQ
jgi:hypothetical protein